MHEFYEQNYACLFNNKQFSVFQVSYFEIYMDKIRDLLDGKWESANCWLKKNWPCSHEQKQEKTRGEANVMTSIKETRLYDTDSASNNDNNVTS